MTQPPPRQAFAFPSILSAATACRRGRVSYTRAARA